MNTGSANEYLLLWDEIRRVNVPWFKFKNPFPNKNSFSLNSFPNLTPSFVLISRAADAPFFELDVMTQTV